MPHPPNSPQVVMIEPLPPQEEQVLSVMVALNIIGAEIRRQLAKDCRLHGCQSVAEYLLKTGFLRESELRIIEMIAQGDLALDEGKRQLLLSSERHGRARIYQLAPHTKNPSRQEMPSGQKTLSHDFDPEETRDEFPDITSDSTDAAEKPGNEETKTEEEGDEAQRETQEYVHPKRLINIESAYRDGVGLAGRQLGKYLLLRPIGRGATSHVFLANHKLLNFTLAVKVLHPNLADGNPGFLERFKREALLLMKLSHPSIVRVTDFDLIDGNYLMAMDYIDGISVNDLIEVTGSLREATVLRIAADVVEGLRAAYKVYIVHRDIKPSNILITGNAEVRLTDFGLARWLNASLDNYATRPMSGLGTPFYCAPEQMEDAASADFKADLYSLGATLYHMLTGRPPFTGATRSQVLRLHRRAQPPHPRLFNPGITEHTSQLILHMLAKNPGNRPSSHAEVLSRLHENLYNLKDKLQDTDYLEQ